MIKKLLASVLLITPVFAYANTAQVCNNCQTETKAAAYARTQSNPLQCSSTFSPDYTCTSRSKIVTFVDWDTEQIYRYNVFTDRAPPWNARAERRSVSRDEDYAFSSLLTFEKELRASITSASLPFNQFISSQSFQSFRNFSNLSNAPDSGSSCPADTALAVVLDTNRLEEVRDFIIQRIQNDELGSNNSDNLTPTTNNLGITLPYRGIQFSLQTNTGSNRRPSIIVDFFDSERPSNRRDFIAFDVGVLGKNPQGDFEYSLRVNDGSRVAGFTLSALRGKDGGRLQIENECIKEKFDQATARGALNMTATPVGGGGGQQGDGSDGSVGGGGGALLPSGSVGGRCTISDFFSDGVLSYTFVDCD